MKDSDDLNQCYAHSKKKHIPPSRLKRAVLHKAISVGPKSTQPKQLKPWGALLAAALTGLVLFNLMLFNKDVSTDVLIESDVVLVEWHGYEQRQSSPAAKLAALQDKQYHDYQHTLAITAQQNTRLATIQAIEGEWALLDCDKNMIKISEQLIAQLYSDDKLNGDFSVGDSVKLAINRDGYIVNIWANKFAAC